MNPEANTAIVTVPTQLNRLTTMKWLVILSIASLTYLHYRLWLGEGSATDLLKLQSEIKEQRSENERLRTRNQILSAEVDALKNTDDAIEERARNELGLIKEGETFFMVIDPKKHQ